MKRSVRAVVMAVIAGALGLTLAVVPSQFSPEQAHAAVSPNIPPPISLLPSIISGVTGTGAGTAAVTAKAQLVRNAVVLATVAEALGKQSAGLPLVKTEVDLIADAVKKIRVPAFKPAALIKAAGPVGLALTAGEIGLMMGNGVVDAVGWGDEGNLCGQGFDGWVSVVNGVDCAGFAAMTAEAIAQANSDVVSGVSGGRVCGTGARATDCYTLVKEGSEPVSGDHMYIFQLDGPWAQPVARTANFLRLDYFLAGNLTNFAVATMTVPNSAGSTIDKRCAIINGGSSLTRGCLSLGNASSGINNSEKMHSYRVMVGAPAAELTVTDLNPNRFLECRIKGIDGITYIGTSAAFKETGGVLPNIVCPTLPAGVDPDEFSIWEVGGGNEYELLPSQTTTPEYDAAKTAYPDCAGSVCLLKLNKEGTDCHTVDGLCADWFEDPDKTTKYTCTNGPYAAPLAECTVYKPTFQPGAKVSPAPYGDPTTGEPLPNSAPNPSSLAGPAIDPAQPRECFPSGWAVFNPVEWVMKPVQCALEWAAVPRIEKVVALQNRASSSWNATTLAKSVTALEGIAPVLAGLSDGNCAGVLIDLGGIAPDVLDIAPARFLPACPGDFFAPWAPWVKSFLVLSLTVGGFFSVKAQLSRFTSNGEA